MRLVSGLAEEYGVAYLVSDFKKEKSVIQTFNRAVKDFTDFTARTIVAVFIQKSERTEKKQNFGRKR